MKTPLTTIAALIASAVFSFAENAPLDAAKITETMKRAADWQLATPNRTEIRFWPIAPLYDGLIDLSEVTGDPKYLAAVIGFGTQAGWTPGPAIYFADEHAVGHAWLDVYLMDPSKKERLAPFKERFDAILAKPITEKLSMGKKPATPGVEDGDRWTWCDALFMAPPTWARLAKATGDQRYLDFMDAEFKAAYDALWDPQENLFFRDATFIGKKSAHGKKVFWARGDGWALATLPLILEAVPEDWPARKFYTELLQKMAPAVLAAQQPDGFWHASLLDPQEIPVGETSGSAFLLYGLVWGVNHGLLDREKYWPAIEKGWNAIAARVEPNGRVGYVQPIGVAPGKFSADSTQLYGTGAVLMTGSEIVRALGAAKQVAPAELLDSAEKFLAEEMQKPRAYVRLVPERKDDLAWENDKVLYRIYGPALRAGDEASGIDAWAKKVPRPVINTWYADDLAGRRSYHQDHGEGYDGYKVGDSLGCGATALWHGDQFVHADVYDRALIFFTKPDVAEFEAFYTYPAVNGVVYNERRTIRLRQGEHLNEIVSRFTNAASKKPVPGLEVAVGLVAQTPKAEITFQPEHGVMVVWDALQPGGEPFGIGAVVSPGAKMLKQPHTTTPPKADHALAIVRTDKNGEVKYRAGFGWPGGGDIASAEAWLQHLSAAPIAPEPAK